MNSGQIMIVLGRTVCEKQLTFLTCCFIWDATGIVLFFFFNDIFLCLKKSQERTRWICQDFQSPAVFS